MSVDRSNGPLVVTLTVICSVLFFGVHCSSGGFTDAELYCGGPMHPERGLLHAHLDQRVRAGGPCGRKWTRYDGHHIGRLRRLLEEAATT
jgi:hypothetical protein